MVSGGNGEGGDLGDLLDEDEDDHLHGGERSRGPEVRWNSWNLGMARRAPNGSMKVDLGLGLGEEKAFNIFL